MKATTVNWVALGLSGFASALSPAQQGPQAPLQAESGLLDPAVRIEQTPVLKLHRQLVQIDSVTGNEEEVGEFLVSHLRSLNFTVDKHAVTSSRYPKKRFNIHAYHGQHRKTRTLLTSHIDTVPPFFNYSIRKPDAQANSKSLEIWGRGTNDDKSCVAAQITALHSLLAAEKVKPSDAGLLFVVGEEAGGDGMVAANDMDLEWEAVIFGEPTESKLAAGHKGFLSFEIETRGQAVHSGYPWLGRSANEIMVAALAGLEKLTKLDESEGGLPQSKKYGRSTLNFGIIQGGVAANVVAEKAVATIAIRLAAGTPTDSKKICLDAITKATAHLLEDGKGSLEVTYLGESYGPVDIDSDIEGFETITVNYGTDVPNLWGNHKQYLYGPGSILVAHSDHEFVRADDVEQAVEDYKKILLSVLNK